MKKNLLYCLLLIVLISCKNNQTEEKTYPFTKEDIMIIYENGYKSGALNAMISRTYDENLWKKDSIFMDKIWTK